MKTLILTLVLIASVNATAGQNPHPTQDQFDMGCMSWSDVNSQYDLSKVSHRDLTTLRFAHANARRFLINAERKFTSADLYEQQETKILICAIVDEATYGFQYECLNEEGEEMISAELIQSCLDLRLPDDQPLS